MNVFAILTGVLGVAIIVCLWRIMAGARELEAARRAAAEAREAQDAAARELRAAQKDVETAKKELGDTHGERTELKKKLFDAKEELKRRQGAQKGRDDQAAGYEARLRDMNHELGEAREQAVVARKMKEEAEKVLGELRGLREKVAALEAAAAKGPRERPAREPREPREPRQPAAPQIPPEVAALSADAVAAATEILALKKRVYEKDLMVQSLKRKLDNASRIYVVTQSQLELAQEKIALSGQRYAELLAKQEGRAAPKPAEPTPAQDAAAEAMAMAAAQDESEPVIPEAPKTEAAPAT